MISLVHYSVNSGFVSIDHSLKTASPFFRTWKTHYLWTSASYFIGAIAAGTIARLTAVFGFPTLILTAPVIVMLYLTYQTYLKTVETSAAQAEQARQFAEQQQIYISELELTRKELHASREHFRNAALHDMLTGLPNRTLLLDRLQVAIDHSARSTSSVFAVLFMDLDRFKIVNDSLGHAAGDQLLVTTARRLQAALRSSDTVARLGGDEFAVILDGVDSSGRVLKIADSLLHVVSQPIHINGQGVWTTASIGIALSTSRCYLQPEELLRDADTAMY